MIPIEPGHGRVFSPFESRDPLFDSTTGQCPKGRRSQLCWNISSRWESFSRIELISVESRGIRLPRIRSCSVLENDIIGIQRTVKVAQSLINRRMGEFPTGELTAILIGDFIRHLWNAVKWLALSDYSRNRFYRLSKCQNNVVLFLVTYFRWKWTAICL